MDEEIINKQKFSFTEFFTKNKYKVLSLIILLIISLAAVIFIDEFKKRKNIEISQNFNKAKILIEKNRSQEAFTILEKIIFEKNSFYSPSALNLIIDNNFTQDKKKILLYYDQIISKTKLDFETKNLFIFKKIIYIGDDIEENELLTNLNPIIRSNSLWKDTVSDYIQKYYLSSGQSKKAKEFENSVNK